MRLLGYLIFLGFASPASAWDFTPIPVCTLAHQTDETELVVTYDGMQTEPYSIAITGPGLENAPVFSIRFDGGGGLTISTDRHRLEGATVTVSDRGFGNVLNGIEFGDTATAILGGTTLAFPLEGADAPMQAFRACIAAPVA